MTQLQFDIICKIIENGAPALANELCSALDAFVRDRNALFAENAELKTQIAELTSDCKCSADCECEHGCKCSVEN